MAKRNEVYKCAECGNIVEVIVPTDKDVCGFKQLKENTTDAATEKHVPVVEKIEGGYRVTVGEVEHPMTTMRCCANTSPRATSRWQSSRPTPRTSMPVSIATSTDCGALSKRKEAA